MSRRWALVALMLGSGGGRGHAPALPAAPAVAGHRQLQAGVVLPLTAGEKAAFLGAHNAERCAHGQDSLSWNDDDQSAAVSLASTCGYAKSSYLGLDNGGRGESLYAVSFHQPAAQAAAAAVGSFAAEKASWDCSTNSCADACSHYKQVVWGATSTLGCAVAHCMSGSPFDGTGDAWTLVACEYSPAGNTGSSTRPFDASSCSGVSTCVDGVAADSAAVEAALTADADAVVADECVSEDDAASRIDVLVLYTHEAVGGAGSVHALELLVHQSVGDANQALLNSRVNLTFHITAIELAPVAVSQAEVASAADLLQLLTISADVKARRDFWLSDLVTLVTERADFEDTASWVLGVSSGEPDHGYSVVQSRALGTQQFVLARALGHNLGCASDARHSSVPAVTEYGYGLRHLSSEPYFRTIMAGGQGCPVGDGDDCLVLPYYSRHQLSPAKCEETAATGSGTDHDACAAVSALDDSTVCSSVMTATLDDAADAAACTYTPAVLASHTLPVMNGGDNTTVPIGSATADCARTIEEHQTVVAQYRVGDDTSCGVGSGGALTFTGVPALPPRGCKNQCSFHGSCDYGAMVCRCRLPWTGDDCSQRLCPDDCTRRGVCDTASGVCKCNGGWTGASCSIRVENFCPNDCAGSAGGLCSASTGHCHCTRSYSSALATDLSSEMSRCTSAEGSCWEGSDFSKRTAAPLVEHPMGEVGSINTLNARDESSLGRQGTVESSWQTVSLAEEYQQPVIFVAMPTDTEDTPAAGRVRNIRYDPTHCNGWCFDMKLQEMDCADDDIHLVERVDYLVIEAGSWEARESDRIFASVFQSDGAGAAPTYTPVIHDVDLTVVSPSTLYVSAGSGDGWVEVRWNFGMATTPVVLSQVQTYEDSRPVITRQKDVTNAGAKLRMQSDLVATDVASDHEEELIGVFAFGTGSVGRFNRRRFAAGVATVGSSAATEIVFRQDFGSRPRVFAALQTTAASSSAAQLRMMAVSESVAQAREGDGGATGLTTPLLHDQTPGLDSRSVAGDYHASIPPTDTPSSAAERLARRESRRAWMYTQPRSGSVCDPNALKSCGGDGWGRGIVASGLRMCGGGMCAVGSMAMCRGPAVGRCSATVAGVDDDSCSAVGMNTADDDTDRANCESAGACTYTHAMQLGADCAAAFAAAGRTNASCSSGCTYIEATGSCPDDAPPDETVGYIAFDVGTTGGGSLQAYSAFRAGPGDDGDCGRFAGPEACNGRGHMSSDQTDRSDCVCDAGFFGAACEYASCPRDCSGRGRCQHLTVFRPNGMILTAAGTCVCSERYHGDGCQYVHCPEGCNGRGICDANTGICTCRPPFLRPACAAGPCVPACENGGTCDELTAMCSCAPPFFGKACELDATLP